MKILLRSFAYLALIIWAGCAAAQTAGDIDGVNVADWGALSNRAEATLDSGQASDAAFEALRSEIAAYREKFADARDENNSRIRTLQSQLDALGPVPEDGEESEAISASRAALNERLEDLRAPQVVAEAAYTRANGLVSEIDTLLRTRQAEALLTRGPVPVNPAYWTEALRDAHEFLRGMGIETERALSNEVSLNRAFSALPLAFFLTVIGLFCLARGRHLAVRLGDYLRGFGGRGSGVWGFVVSLGRIFIPLLGVFLLTRAAQVLDLTGMRGSAVLDAIPYWSAIILGFAWLGEPDDRKPRRAWVVDNSDQSGPVPDADLAAVSHAGAARCQQSHHRPGTPVGCDGRGTAISDHSDRRLGVVSLYFGLWCRGRTDRA